MRIRKIKSADGMITIIASETGPKGKWGTDETFTSHDAPQPAFAAALKKLVPHVQEICELDEVYCEGMQVRGVSFSYDDDDNLGVVITTLKPLAIPPGPLVINTPFVSEREVEDVGASMSGDLAFDLEALMKAAIAYRNGVREQADMFAGPAAA